MHSTPDFTRYKAVTVSTVLAILLVPTLSAQQAPALASIEFSPEQSRGVIERFGGRDALATSIYDGLYETRGGTISLRGVGAKVILVANGQAAMDALLDAGAQGFVHRQRNAAATEALESLMQEDVSEFSEHLNEIEKVKAEADIKRLFDLFRNRYGKLLRFDVLGTQMAPSGKQNTFARLSFERGSEDIRFVWEGKNLRTVQRHPIPAVVVVAVPVAQDELLIVDPDADETRYIRFDRGERGDFKVLNIRGGIEEYSARRVR